MIQNRKKQFGINVVSGWVQQGARIIIGFFLLPYAMNRLGEEQYGIYQLAFSAIVFFNFLQIGIGPALVRFSAQALAIGDNERLKKISSSSQLLLNSIGLVGMSGILVITPIFIKFYNISETLVTETTGMIVCMSVSFFLSFWCIAQQSLLLAANRYELSNGIQIAQNLFRVLFVVSLFEFVGPSILFYGIAILASQGIRALLLFVFVCQNIGRSAVFSFQSASYAVVKEILSFSLLVMIQTIAYTAVFQGPSLLIGKILGPGMVALFAPALLVATAMQGFIGQSLNPIVTFAAQEKIKSNDKNLGVWILDISQMVAFAGFGFLALFFLFGHDIVGIWLGIEKAWLWKVVVAVSLGAVLLPIQGVIGRMAIGASSIKASAFSMVILAAIIILGSMVGMLYSSWDILDVALFMGICILTRSIYMAFYYHRYFNYSFSNYIVRVYIYPAMVAGVLGLSSFLIVGELRFSGFLWVVIQSLSIGCLYAVAGWYLLLPSSFKFLVKRKFFIYRRNP